MVSSMGTALVTGASSGIGAVYADRLARRGYDLVLVARDAARLEGVRERLSGTGRAVETVAADLAAQAGRQRVEDRLRSDEAITMLVNNAGRAIVSPLSQSAPGDMEDLIELNVVATTLLAAAAAATFGRLGRGTIVNIASIVAFVPEALNATYPASKAYLLSLTLALQAELAPKGVRVQAVCPGITITDIWTKSGIDPHGFPAGQAMPVNVMVDAALAGLDLGEVVTIPALEDADLYAAYEAARRAMGPHLSRSEPAGRYRAVAPSAA